MEKKDMEQVAGMFEHISENMVTKKDLAELRAETQGGFVEVNKNISELRKDLDITTEVTESNKGFTKEIDILFESVKKINKHLGLESSF